MTWKITGAPGTGDNLLYSQAGTPTLDLRFASSKSLVDNVSGQNLIDFTRGGNGVGTYVGSDGLIKNSVVNLLLQSEDFSTTWGQVGVGTSVTANATTAPNGTNTADRMQATSGASGVQQVIDLALTPHTYSIYVKKAGVDDAVRFSLGPAYLTFNLVTGTFSDVDPSYDPPTATQVGNGWWRISATRTPTATANAIRIYSTLASDVDVYIWGAQVEQSATPGEYVKTTSSISGAPRFDHDPETGESLGLLVEEQRTNLLLRSEEFDNGAWTNSGTLITANQTVAPDGITTADEIVSDVLTLDQAFSNTVTTYTASVFVKQNNAATLTLSLVGGLAGLNGGAIFTFASNSVSSTGTVVSVSSQEFSDGWYRISAVLTATGAASPQFRIAVGGGGSCYIWGAQLEVGAFPTSYIPTTASTVTRSADVVLIKGSNFSRWYSQGQGTVFADITGYPIGPSEFPRIFELSNGASSLIRLQQYSSPNNKVRVSINTDGVTQMAQDGGAILQGDQGKVALGFINDDCALVVDGGSPSVDTSVPLATNMTQAFIGGTPGGTSVANSTIRRITYFDRRLPNATLQAITA